MMRRVEQRVTWIGRWLLYVILLGMMAFPARAESGEPVRHDIKTVKPTCMEDGYTVYENPADGSLTIADEVPALGHDPGEWEREPGSEYMVATCRRCGVVLKRADYEGEIPRIDLAGNLAGISKSDRILLDFQYTGKDEAFTCYAYTTWQGHKSLEFPKKNYTIRLYDDTGITQKHRLSFRGWQMEHKYVLKANYRDPSLVRNLVAADVWAAMAETRPNLPEELRDTSHMGAVDGFPVAVYLNGEFHGLYTMNLHIDDDLYQMKGKRDAVMIANDSTPEETRFQALAAFIDEKSAWEVEFCATEDSGWAKDKLNEFIAFVMDSDDETFRAHLPDYLDVDGAIDYLIYIYALGLPDNAAKDLVLLTYDAGPWIPTVYDMEHAFGLAEDGADGLAPTDFLPDKQDGRWTSGTGSLLWDRLLQCWTTALQDRYRALRQGTLDAHRLVLRINAASNAVPGEYRDMDMTLYPRDFAGGDPLEQMTGYIAGRLPALDMAILGEAAVPVPMAEQDDGNGGAGE